MEYTYAGSHEKSFKRPEPSITRLIGELVTGRRADESANGGECWNVAFAPDESRLAWSSGYRNIVLIPWNRYKNCLQSEDNLDEEGGQLFTDRIEVDCNFLVCCLAFGTSTPEGELVPSPSKCYWQRLDCTKHLVLATGHNNGRIRVWDPYNGRLVLELTDHRKPVTCLAFAPDGSLRLASGSDDGTIKVWDMSDDGNMFKTLTHHRHPVRSIAWSPDSKLLCSTGNKQKALLWNMEDYTLLYRLSGHYNDVLSCAFSPDGAIVATASADTRVVVWDTAIGEQIRELNHVSPQPGVIYMSGSNNSRVLSVSFSPQGCHLATVCSDGLLRYWDLSSEGEHMEGARAAPEGDSMLTSTFSPMGGALAVGYASGNVLFYSTPCQVPSLLHLSRMSIRRSFGDIVRSSGILLPHSIKPYLQYKQW